MNGARIQSRVWRSIGIFVLGFLLTIIVAQVERRAAEKRLAVIAGVMFPLAQRGHDAKAAFQKVVDGYNEAVLIEDPSGLYRAANDSLVLAAALNAIGENTRISGTRAQSARRLEGEIQRFLDEANYVYRRSLPDQGMTPALQERIRRLSIRTAELNVEIGALDAALTHDLQREMDELQGRSAYMRVFQPIVFGATFVLAAVLVNRTIRRSILAPLSKAAAELARERDLLRILMDHIPDYIYFKDGEGRYVRINKAKAELLGVEDPADACGHSDRDYFDPEVAERREQDEQRILATGVPMVSSLEHMTRRGLNRWVTTTEVPVFDVAQNGPMIVGISRDITAWKEAVESLAESETSFRLLFSAIPHAVWVCDVDTLEILEVNQAAVQRYGYSAEEFARMHIGDVYPAEDRERVKRTLTSLDPGNPPRGARQHVAKDGRILYVDIVTHLLDLKGRKAILIMAQDVSQRKRLELELRHAQRLEAVGQLAAGIAHEINTPIQFIGDNLHFLQDAFGSRQGVMEKYRQLHEAALAGEAPGRLLNDLEAAIQAADMEYLVEEIPKALEQSLDGVDRVATIVRAMKVFAHPGRKEKAAADLNKALADALIVSRNELKYVADIVTDYGDLEPVVCYLADLNQVFLNLLINAAQAIGEVVKSSGGKGVISVKTKREGDQVVISISDTGCGIPEAIRSRIFDQFFTTKEVGRGTGQGLSLARAIVVEKHGGRIVFEPNLPRGTTFLVYLPIEPMRASFAAEPELVAAGGIR